MLQEIQSRGYKAFGDRLALKLRPITVFFGKNNSGKTSLARLPIVIAAGFTESESLYSLAARGLSFGSSFAELASMDNPHPSISYGIKWSQRKRISIDLQHIASSEDRDRVQPTSVEVNGYRREISLLNRAPRSALTLVEGVLSEAALRGFTQRTADLRVLLETLVHIPSSRPRINGLYDTRVPEGWTAEEVPYLLQARQRLLRDVDQWFQRNLDNAGVDIDQAAFAFRLVETRGDLAVNLTQSGRGLQSALAVTTLLLGIASGVKSSPLTIVEEPEAHLHPSVHGAMADLVIASALKSQVIVETHSENFLLRLRRRIAEKRLSREDVILYFVDEAHHVHEIALDEFGATTNWPVGVFESDVEEARAIVEAKLSMMSESQ
jgi:predicted ATPase